MPVNAPIAFYETKYRQSRSGRSRFYIAAALRSVASDGGRATRLGLQTSISAAAYDLSSATRVSAVSSLKSRSVALQGLYVALSIFGGSKDGPKSHSKVLAIAFARSVAYGILLNSTKFGTALSIRSQNTEVLLIRSVFASLMGARSFSSEIPHSGTKLAAHPAIRSAATGVLLSGSQLGTLLSFASESIVNRSSSAAAMIASLKSSSVTAATFAQAGTITAAASRSFEVGVRSQAAFIATLRAGTGAVSQFGCDLATQAIAIDIDVSRSSVAINAAVSSISSAATLSPAFLTIGLGASSVPFAVGLSSAEVATTLAAHSDSYPIPVSSAQAAVTAQLSSVPVLALRSFSSLGLLLSAQSISEESSQQDEYTFVIY
jgi:hypothetical protein